jgi:predicted transposase YdaD
VKVLNINQGRNKEIVERCRTLAGYCAFVAKVRDYEKEGFQREESIKNAIKYCREHDILKEFFERNATEVMNMLMTEWNIEDAKKVWYEEGMERGMEEAARNALAQGASIEFIQKITGLDIETIMKLQA